MLSIKLLFMKLLLAIHKGAKSTEFIRGAVQPFLEENVAKGGKKATVIYGHLLYPRVFGCKSVAEAAKALSHTELKKKSLQRSLGMIEASFNRELARSIGTGADSLLFRPNEGFEDLVMGLNVSCQMVSSVVEPQIADVAFADVKLHNLHSQIRADLNSASAVDLMMEVIKLHAYVVVRRSKETLRLIESISSSDPESVAILPRPSAFREMEDLFKRAGHEVICVDEGEPLQFIDRATTKIFTGNLVLGDLSRFAKLQLAYLKFLGCYDTSDIRASLEALYKAEHQTL